MADRCTYTPDDLDGSGLNLRCGREAGHDGDHHLLAISDDGRACWLYVEDGLRPLEPTIHLDMRPGSVDDEMAMALCAVAVALVERADAATESGAEQRVTHRRVWQTGDGTPVTTPGCGDPHCLVCGAQSEPTRRHEQEPTDA